MEANLQQFEYNKNRTNQVENRKRGSNSGRMSPRSLFGNLRPKKTLMDENSYTSRNWKPPIKMDTSNSNNIRSPSSNPGYNSSHIEDDNSHQDHMFNEDEPNQNYDIKENFTFEDDESENDSFDGNSGETVAYEEKNMARSVGNIHGCDIPENLKIQDTSIHAHLNDNPLKVNDPDLNKELELSKRSQELTSYDGYLAYSGSEVMNTKKGNVPGISIYNPDNSHNNNFDKLHKEDMRDFRNFERIEEQVHEQSDHFRSTLEYIEEAKNILAGSSNVANKTESQHEMKLQNMQDIKPMNMSIAHCIDDSFDLTFSNSQFLQLEKQVTNAGNKSCNDNKVIHNLEAVKRCSSSLAAQTEWQKDVVKGLIKEVDGLNKSLESAISSLKSIQRNNVPGK